MSSRPFENPFRRYRAEQFSENLWSYYVPLPFVAQLGPRPLVIEGGRGSGKSMFFLCSAWKERTDALASEGKRIDALLNQNDYVGLYYRVDGPFVSALDGSDLAADKWNALFSTYLSVCIGRELFAFLGACERSKVVTTAELRSVIERAADLLSITQAPPRDLDSVARMLSAVLDTVAAAANDPERIKSAPLTVPGRFIGELVTAIRKLPQFSSANFQIFIDEYETLLSYQQRQVNALIKHSVSYLVYNIGLRPKGMKTPKTTSESEVIEDPHDFSLVNPESVLGSDGTGSLSGFEDVLKQICQKRLANSRALPSNVDAKWLDIESYLGSFSIDDELAEIDGLVGKPEVYQELERLISAEVADSNEAARVAQILGPGASTSCARLHLCLLRRRQYRPSATDLATEYQSWRQSPTSSKRYADWWHNTKFGLVVLLSKEHRRDKWYAGLDVYAMLSSGIIRYFIELCEHAFDFAHEKGFSWEAPRELSEDEQSRAARYVSRYKIRDIERYEPDGASLRQLVVSLGNIFSALQKDQGTTLGEPEVNHFSSAIAEAGESRVTALLSAAVLWTVLQERAPTKDKDVDLKVDPVNYHINHIYCPHFGISYRQKRKIEIRPNELLGICGLGPESTPNSERPERVRSAVRALLTRLKVVDTTPDPETSQLQLL